MLRGRVPAREEKAETYIYQAFSIFDYEGILYPHQKVIFTFTSNFLCNMGRLYPLLVVITTLNELTMVSDHERHKRLLAAIQEIESCGLSVYRGRKKDKHFMKIYSEPLYNLLPKLSPSATKVWLALGNEVDYEDTVVEMTIAEIMERTNLSDKPVKTAIRQLEELGVLTRIGPNNRRKYVLSEMYVKRGK